MSKIVEGHPQGWPFFVELLFRDKQRGLICCIKKGRVSGLLRLQMLTIVVDQPPPPFGLRVGLVDRGVDPFRVGRGDGVAARWAAALVAAACASEAFFNSFDSMRERCFSSVASSFIKGESQSVSVMEVLVVLFGLATWNIRRVLGFLDEPSPECVGRV